MSRPPKGYFHPARHKPRAKSVREVETFPCPATLGSETHELTNRRGKTVCVWCEVEWRVLDAEARAAS